MTDEQKKLAEDNLNLVYYYMNQHKLDYETYYDILCIKLCEAAKVYDETMGYQFSSLAYKYFASGVNKHIVEQNLRKNKCEGGVLHWEALGPDWDLDCLDILKTGEPTPEELYIARELIENLMSCCETDKERMILRYAIENKSMQPIADKYGISRQAINKTKKRVFQRYRERYGV